MNSSELHNNTWLEYANCFSKEFPLNALEPTATRFLAKASPNTPIALALSGGPDSIALLLILYKYYKHNIHILHFNHNTRDQTNDEQKFIESIADSLKLPIHVNATPPTRVPNPTEAYLRSVRLEFFKNTLKSLNANVLLTAHHANDVAETMVMRLCRGSGTAGLAAPRPIQEHKDYCCVRPLINIPKVDILTVFRKLNAPYVKDPSNASQTYFRNRVRSQIIPILKHISPSKPLASIIHSRKLLQEDDDALNTWLNSLIQAPISGQDFDLSPIIALPSALHRRAIHKYLNINNLELSVNAVETLLAHIAEDTPYQTPVGPKSILVFEDKHLSLNIAQAVADPFKLPLKLEDEVLLPNRKSLTVSCVEMSQDLVDRITTGKVDPTKEAYLNISPDALTARSWSPGDAYQPLNSPGTTKVQDLFTNKKIPKQTRHTLPIVTTQDGTILWVPGFPPNHQFKVLPSANSALRLTYT